MEQKEFDNLKVGNVVKLERNGVHYVKIIDGPLYQSIGGLGKSFECKDLDNNRDIVIYSYDTLEKLKEVTDEYQEYRLLDENYSLSERIALDDLKRGFTNISSNKGLPDID